MLRKVLIVFVVLSGLGLCGKIALRHARENRFADAVTQGDTAAVERFLAEGMNPNLRNRYNTPLLGVALNRGDTVSAMALLKAGADVHHPYYGYLLSRALEAGRKELALDMIARGCNSAGTNMYGESPLTYSAHTYNLEVAEALIRAGADLESRSKSEGGGCTPLMYAAMAGDTEMIALLLRSGARMDARSNKSKTALCYALERNQPEAVKTLLAKGASREAINAENQNALTVAQNLKRPQLIALFQSEQRPAKKKEL